jgi:elongation factor 1 alpha-like protein
VKLNIVSKEEVFRNKKEAELIGKQTFHFAWLLDQMVEERQKGVTIDTNERTIE